MRALARRCPLKARGGEGDSQLSKHSFFGDAVMAMARVPGNMSRRRATGSGALGRRHRRRLQAGAVGPAIEILDDLLVARATRFWRLRLVRELTRKLNVLCHGRSPRPEHAPR